MATQVPESTAPQALQGRVLEGSAGVRYLIYDQVGEGAQGWVFRATWDDPSGVIVVVKVLRPNLVGTGDTALRFGREADVLRMLLQQMRPNPYIVRYYDHAVTQVALVPGGPAVDVPFTVLEYVHGPTLLHALRGAEGRGLPAERVRRLGLHVVHALETVHGAKLVHRDLKPSNILLSSEGGVEVAKITDFGLVKVSQPDVKATVAFAGASLGYAPPEQFEAVSARVSARTDVFSLAAVLFEMLACRRAFAPAPGEPPLGLVVRMMNGPRPSLVRARESVAPEIAQREDVLQALDAELQRALQTDPDQRHASAAEFWSRVEPALRAVAVA